MHIVDFIIIVLCLGALLRGYQIGLLRQLSSTIAFLVGLYPGTLLSSMVMSHMSGPSRPLAGLAVLLTVCFALMTVAELIAVRIKVAVRNTYVQKLDDGAGAIMSVVTLLLGLWLASAIFSLAPPSAVQAQLKNSAILSRLTSRLPPAAQVLSAFNRLIDPNQSPQVFAGREPSPEANYPLPDAQQYNALLSRIEPSVVKIEGLGCGGIVDGSGFVFSPELVVTNAHVVAGVQSPKIRTAEATYNTVVVHFDPDNDIAVLRVAGLKAPALTINRMNAAAGSTIFALGYPGGGNFTVSPGVVLDRFEALGQDIYGKKRTTRDVYSLQTTVVRGNSGGPVVSADGAVIGVVFATSTTYNNIGYALTMEQIHEQLRSAEAKTAAISTGKCSE
jgi:S1-C subfamily serine protease